MPVGNIVAGGPIIAADHLDELAAITARLPIRARQTAPVPKTNNTLANLTGLSAPVAASTVYRLTARIVAAGSNTTHDIKIGITLPASATIEWSMYGGPTSLTTTTTTVDMGTTAATTHSRGTLSGQLTYLIEGVITVAGTAGTVQLQGAQNTTDAGTLTFEIGSTMSLEVWV